MSFFTRFSSKKNAKGVIGESSDIDIDLRRKNVEVRPCEWPHYPFLDAAGIRHEFEHFAANAGLAEFLADECDQHYLLTNSSVQNFKYLSGMDPPEVEFHLYAETYQIPLAEFCDAYLIPSHGDVRDPRQAEFDEFTRTLTVGDDRGASRVTPTSL
jgi:hypothetical protein